MDTPLRPVTIAALQPQPTYEELREERKYYTSYYELLPEYRWDDEYGIQQIFMDAIEAGDTELINAFYGLYIQPNIVFTERWERLKERAMEDEDVWFLFSQIDDALQHALLINSEKLYKGESNA